MRAINQFHVSKLFVIGSDPDSFGALRYTIRQVNRLPMFPKSALYIACVLVVLFFAWRTFAPGHPKFNAIAKYVDLKSGNELHEPASQPPAPQLRNSASPTQQTVNPLVAALAAPNLPIFVSGSMSLSKDVQSAFTMSDSQHEATEARLRLFATQLSEMEKAASALKMDDDSGLPYIEISPFDEGEMTLAELRSSLEQILGPERAEAMALRIRKEPFFGMVGRFRQEWYYSEEEFQSKKYPVCKVTIHRNDGESSIAMPPQSPAIEQRFGTIARQLRE
jgi:hypothetical protein